MDTNKIYKALVILVMAAALAVIVIAASSHAEKGLAPQESKLILGAYVLMGIYAAFRILVNIRDIFRS